VTVNDLLKRKGPRLLSAGSNDTLLAVAEKLSNNDVGALAVLDEQSRLVGIVSERDLVRALAKKPGEAQGMHVKSLMTRDVVVCAASDRVRTALLLMKWGHIRHLPVMDDGTLIGIISQRDVMEALLEQDELEIKVLRDSVLPTY
jgi:CBS domain-containing protein